MTADAPLTTRQRVLSGTIIGLSAVSFALPVTDAGLAHAMFGYQALFWGLCRSCTY